MEREISLGVNSPACSKFCHGKTNLNLTRLHIQDVKSQNVASTTVITKLHLNKWNNTGTK